jgi:hypothetical protein
MVSVQVNARRAELGEVAGGQQENTLSDEDVMEQASEVGIINTLYDDYDEVNSPRKPEGREWQWRVKRPPPYLGVKLLWVHGSQTGFCLVWEDEEGKPQADRYFT